MGFLKAVYDLGRIETDDGYSPDWADIDSFLSLPLPYFSANDRSYEEKNGRVIRVWLKVRNPFAKTLEISGVEKIDLVDFLAGDGSMQEKKRKYLYKDKPGSNTQWSFSPLYKLGQPKKESRKELIGENGDWQNNTATRFYKLKRTTLEEFEKLQVLSPGSVSMIMEYLEDKINDICALWTDTKRSYILLFGIGHEGRFLYPGEVPAFVSYFKKKIASKSPVGRSVNCAFCGASEENATNLDKIFKFATFDKKSFLPGNDETSSRTKVFPLCQQCFSSISKGKGILDLRFTDARTIPNTRIYIVPELTLGSRSLEKVGKATEEFLRTGIKVEEKLFSHLAKQGEGLVLHFLFWSKNQAQEQVHALIEDVPPSRLKRLEFLWRESLKSFSPFVKENTETGTLDTAIRSTVRTLLGLAGKNEQDQVFQRARVYEVISKLLGGERIDVKGIKMMMVARFPGLFADAEWLVKKGRFETGSMYLIVDFIERANRR